MNDMFITDSKGNNFVINKTNGQYEVYKVVDGNRISPTKEELEFILNEIRNIKSIKPQERPKNLDDYIKLLKEMINNKKIVNFDQLSNFIKSCELSGEEKVKLSEAGIADLQIQDIIQLKNRIINSLKEEKRPDLKALINFNIKDNSIGAKYCEVKLNYQSNNNTTEHIKEQLNYNDTLKRELIEPVLLEIAIQSQIKDNFIVKVPNDINNRSNYMLSTDEDIMFNLNNVEYEYADKLQKRCMNLKDKQPVNDAEERSEKISELQDEAHPEDSNRKDFENVKTDEQGLMYDVNGNYIGRIDENGNVIRENSQPELDKGRARVRVPKGYKTNGFAMTTIILAVTSLVSSVLFLIQIFWLS